MTTFLDKKTVPVCSGCVWIGDPGFMLENPDWDKFCSESFQGSKEEQQVKPIKEGVLISTGGDGDHNIEVFRNSTGRATKIIVRFPHNS